MNDQLQNFARISLKVGLSKLPETWQYKFKQMYSHGNLDANINDVVDNMPEEKLDWAMQQVNTSIKKFESQKNQG